MISPPLLLIATLARAAPTNCARAFDTSEITDAATLAEAAFRNVDAEAYSVARNTLEARLRCAGEVLSPSADARVELIEALGAFLDGRTGQVPQALAGLFAAEPGHQIPSTLLPDGHPVRALIPIAMLLLKGDPGVPLPVPASGWIEVDAEHALAAPSKRTAVLQQIDGQGEVVATHLRWPDELGFGWMVPVAASQKPMVAAPSTTGAPHATPAPSLPPFRSPTLGLMPLIPVGTFEMGSAPTEKGRRDDETQHTVTLTQAFYLMEREVTQAQWATVMGTNPSHFMFCGPDCPVENVSWSDAQTFVRKASQRDGQDYRLPSEAEWEYAARGGEKFLYAGSDTLDEVAWYKVNSGMTAHPGCEKRRNGFGLCDMTGSVYEWVARWYAPYPATPAVDRGGGATRDDPLFVNDGSAPRVNRGGAWCSLPAESRIARRATLDPTLRHEDIGLRLALSAR